LVAGETGDHPQVQAEDEDSQWNVEDKKVGESDPDLDADRKEPEDGGKDRPGGSTRQLPPQDRDRKTSECSTADYHQPE
jgi:hypothetical protein